MGGKARLNFLLFLAANLFLDHVWDGIVTSLTVLTVVHPLKPTPSNYILDDCLLVTLVSCWTNTVPSSTTAIPCLFAAIFCLTG